VRALQFSFVTHITLNHGLFSRAVSSISASVTGELLVGMLRVILRYSIFLNDGARPVKSKKRKLYKIGYLTRLLGITPRTIRYYDQFGLLPHVKRSDGGMRLFDDEDVEIIKQVRRMQKEKFMPLDVIRDRLFGEKKSPLAVDRVVVTDSSVTLDSGKLDLMSVHILPFQIEVNGKTFVDGKTATAKDVSAWIQAGKKPVFHAPTEDDFIDCYRDLSEKGFKTIYSVHCSSKLSDVFQNASSAAAKVSDEIEVKCIDSKAMGAGLGLCVHLIGEAIEEGQSQQELDLLITKQLPLIYDLYLVDNLQFLVDQGLLAGANQSQRQILKQFLNFKALAVFKDGAGDIEMFSCRRLYDEAVIEMAEQFFEEVSSRGRYVKEILIHYAHLYGEALGLVTKVKEMFPNTPIEVVEGSAISTTFIGPSYIGIAII